MGSGSAATAGIAQAAAARNLRRLSMAIAKSITTDRHSRVRRQIARSTGLVQQCSEKVEIKPVLSMRSPVKYVNASVADAEFPTRELADASGNKRAQIAGKQ